MTNEEFLKLAEKFMAGECTPAEEALLRAYDDPIHLSEDVSDQHMPDRDMIYKDLHDRLGRETAKDPGSKEGIYYWLKVAAIFLIFFSAGALFKRRISELPNRQEAYQKPSGIRILPGGNNAYLTLSDGSRIALNNKENGKLTAEQGISINKTRDGLLVYDAANAAEIPGSDHYNIITTPIGGQYQVILSDSTRVWLNASSSLKFPVAFSHKERVVEITGEAYFEVSKNKKCPFTVKANHNEILVLGTHFNVSAYPDDQNMTTTLLEGSVSIRNGPASAILRPGQQGTVTVNETGIIVNKADLEASVSWKNGLFIFRDENIVSIMKKMARWYNVEVAYQGNVKNKAFGGTVSRFKNIAEFLDIMKLAGGIHYNIEGRKVIISD